MLHKPWSLYLWQDLHAKATKLLVFSGYMSSRLLSYQTRDQKMGINAPDWLLQSPCASLNPEITGLTHTLTLFVYHAMEQIRTKSCLLEDFNILDVFICISVTKPIPCFLVITGVWVSMPFFSLFLFICALSTISSSKICLKQTTFNWFF